MKAYVERSRADAPREGTVMRTFVIFGFLGTASVCGLALIPACGGGSLQLPDAPSLDGGGEGGALTAHGVGEPCATATDCRPGLACNGGTCQPGRSSETGTACVISAECKDGLYCGPERTCAPAGAGESGATCASDGDCKSGLRCNLVGFGAECQPEGNKDVGGTCAMSGDCFGGLLCADKVCAPPPAGGPPPIAIPGFKGVACEDETALGVTAHFRVPRGDAEDKDFFRLPFPNDVRRSAAGKLNLQGFPTPGADLLGFDLVDRWARFLEQTANGWSVYPTITFRFSGEIDFDSLKLANATRWVDISQGEGNDLGHNWVGTTARSAYVCPNNVAFRPPTGSPLKHGHTYAVLMTNVAKAKGGGVITVSNDLKALLAGTAPADPALATAHTAYAPLRTWAQSKGFNLDNVVNATVFTVGNHDAIAKALPGAVTSAPPTSKGWVKCGSGPSPCPQAEGDRACPATTDPAFEEWHGLVTLPQFQKGTLPFTEPSDGGDLEIVGGQPKPQGTIEVCAALTIPTGATIGNLPLVVYAHGTGGSFRSHITEGVAGRLATETTKIAVLGIDQVGHGTRRGASTAQPQNIFFNFTNPAAAQGNVLQGAADQISLVRLAKSPALGAFFGATFGNVAFWGHSQGATEGAIAMPYLTVTEVGGTLFSGVGGSLIDSLLTKKSPVNLIAVAPAVLSESPAAVTGTHPALAMFQNAIDPADPLDHAAAVLTANPRHVFVPFGQNDTYSTPITQLTYALAAGLGVAAPAASVTTPDDFRKTPIAIPASANINGKTMIVRQYAPGGYDGHFVVFRDDVAKVDANHFLNDVVAGSVPQIGR